MLYKPGSYSFRCRWQYRKHPLIAKAKAGDIFTLSSKNYLKDISSEIKIDKAFLFGTYAKGDYKKDSDIDLAIFSDSFKRMTPVEGIQFYWEGLESTGV